MIGADVIETSAPIIMEFLGDCRYQKVKEVIFQDCERANGCYSIYVTFLCVYVIMICQIKLEILYLWLKY